MQAVVDNGVVAWPYGTVCLHHLLLLLSCSTQHWHPQTCIHVTMYAMVNGGQQSGSAVCPVYHCLPLSTTVYHCLPHPAPGLGLPAVQDSKGTAAFKMRRACEYTNLL